MGADLHLHTTASDGSLRPTQIVKIALEVGLEAIAITDHDTFAGVEQAITVNNTDLQIIPGIELSCDLNGRDIHILAYWLDYKAKWLNDELDHLKAGRYERARLMVEKLKENGFDIIFDEVLNLAGDAALGRSHVARAMLQKGYIDSIQEVFDKYLGQDSCCYVSKPTKTPEEVLKLVARAGGVAVLAHPALEEIDTQIPDLVDKGLVGIEANHPDHSVEQIKYYEEMCSHYNLVATAGSDFHAQGSKRGARLGAYQVDMLVVERLKSRLPNSTIR